MKRRVSPRLKHFDYSTPGAYFVTIATRNRRPLLAFDSGGELVLTKIGQSVAKSWRELQRVHVNAVPDCFAVMPDHFHGVVLLNLPWLPGHDPDVRHDLCKVIGSFKQFTQSQAWSILRERSGKVVRMQLWQPRFHDRVMRDERHLMSTREYIMMNPLAWKLRKYGLVLQEDKGHMP